MARQTIWHIEVSIVSLVTAVYLLVCVGYDEAVQHMKKILVTGAGGFIGHWMGRYLKEKGYWVRGVDIEAPHFSNVSEFDEFWQDCDLRKEAYAMRACEGIDSVYHFAAMNGSIEMTTNNKAELVHNNALINLNMAEASYKNTVKKVLFSSSACVYPIQYQSTDLVHALKEEDVDPAHPDTEYGWEKLFSEHVWRSYFEDRGIQIAIPRFINVFGTEGLIDTLRSKAPMALTKKVITAGNGGIVRIWGDGEQKRTFCYITDLLDGIYTLMESHITEPINLGSDHLVSINELVDMIADIEGIRVKKVHELHKIQGVRTRMPDITKARVKLHWKPKVTLHEGLVKINKFVHKELKKSVYSK